MGHARAYLSFDILRRIMVDYFGYQVTMIMNITDIDDKIILRAAEEGIDHSVLSKRWEQAFHQDMRDLGVMAPTVLTRVTECMPEIVAYIEQIIDNGIAYEADGSVYFDVQAFEASGHVYGKLCPEHTTNSQQLDEGEVKTGGTTLEGPKADLAGTLNAPSWPLTSWRPSLESKPWIFIPEESICNSRIMTMRLPKLKHTAAASKMSKSLKNFITIQQALEINSARQIRLLFLLHKYDEPMEYGDDTMRHDIMQHALDAEKRFTEFFHNVKASLRNPSLADGKWNVGAIHLQKQVNETSSQVDAALRDDFNTVAATGALLELIKHTNIYMEEPDCHAAALKNAALFITRILRIFGLCQGSEEIGFGATGESASRVQILGPVLDESFAKQCEIFEMIQKLY